jgi:hypothetical protein
MNTRHLGHNARQRLTTAQLVTELREALRPTLLAVMAGAENVATVDDWACGRTRPPKAVLDRLRSAHHALSILLRHEDVETIRAWFRGMNPLLEDKSPARVLREDPEAVIAAARAFVESPDD